MSQISKLLHIWEDSYAVPTWGKLNFIGAAENLQITSSNVLKLNQLVKK